VREWRVDGREILTAGLRLFFYCLSRDNLCTAQVKLLHNCRDVCQSRALGTLHSQYDVPRCGARTTGENLTAFATQYDKNSKVLPPTIAHAFRHWDSSALCPVHQRKLVQRSDPNSIRGGPTRHTRCHSRQLRRCVSLARPSFLWLLTGDAEGAKVLSK
jgi:hypothetical protein